MASARSPGGDDTPSIYLAGPFGFTEPGRRYLSEVVMPVLAGHGFRVLDPWAAGAELLAPVLASARHDADEVLAACAALGARNAALIEAADSVLALVDGCDLDSGTCAEIGFAAGRAVPVIAFRTDTRPGGDVAEILINLQVQHFVTASGGALFTNLDDAVDALERLLR